MEVDKEKRLSSRVRLKSPLHYRTIAADSKGFRSAAVQDVSLTGIRFHSHEFVPKRANFIVEMNLLGHAPVHSLARAIWVRERPHEGGYEVGGVFVEPSPGALTALVELVSG